MKKQLLIVLALLCLGGTISAQVRTTRSVSVKRTRIQTEYQYFVRFGAGALDLGRSENTYGRRSTMPFGGVINWGFRKPFNNSNLSVYWGMEYGLAPYSAVLHGYYNERMYQVYTSDGQQRDLPNSEYDHPFFSVYTHALNARPFMLGLDFKAAPDISVDLHAGIGLNMTLFGRYIYDNGDSFNMKHGDGTVSLSKNNGMNKRLYCDIQAGLGVWWKNLNLEVTAVAIPRNIELNADVPYEYVSYNQYGSNPQNYTGIVHINAEEYFVLQLLVRLGIAF